MLMGNKGEWSEVYALLKIVADGKLYPGDANLQKVESLFYPVIKILREESSGTYEFSYDRQLVLIAHNEEQFCVPIHEFQHNARLLLAKLKERTQTTFSIPAVEEFMDSFGSKTLKARSSSKSDIRLIIHDQKTGLSPELGFSIKSQLGHASTLLNASGSTNFIYKIVGRSLSNKDIEKINAIDSRSKIKDRLLQINVHKGRLNFVKIDNAVFENNLVLIDSALPRILAEALMLFYTSELSKVSDLVNKLSEINPLQYNLQAGHPFYSYKIKRLLTDVALGMMPSKVWTGQLEATGGYLVVKDDGDVLCYHIYNRNEFESYLYENTKLETPSSSRHGFGIIEAEGGDFYFKLNLQIRFCV